MTDSWQIRWAKSVRREAELQIRGGIHTIFFLFFHENISCGYSIEAPRQGASNEYRQHMFSWRNKKDISIFRMKKVPYLLLCGKGVIVIWATSETYPKCAVRSSCTCTKNHLGLCSPFIYSVVSNDSVSWQWRPWSDCTDVQAQLDLPCLHMLEDVFTAYFPSTEVL